VNGDEVIEKMKKSNEEYFRRPTYNKSKECKYSTKSAYFVIIQH